MNKKFLFPIFALTTALSFNIQAQEEQKPINRIDFRYTVVLEDPTQPNRETWNEINKAMDGIRFMDTDIDTIFDQIEELHNFITTAKQQEDASPINVLGTIGCFDAPSCTCEEDFLAPEEKQNENAEKRYLYLYLTQGNLDDETWECICEQTIDLIDYCKQESPLSKDFHYILDEIKSIVELAGAE